MKYKLNPKSRDRYLKYLEKRYGRKRANEFINS